MGGADKRLFKSNETDAIKTVRYLVEGETRLDKSAAALVTHLGGLRWPRRWSAIRRWDTLVASEIERLHAAHGAAAFPDWLTRRTRINGEETIELTAHAEEQLARREGARGWRRVLRDEDGVAREYFIKRLDASGGHIEARLSWYNGTWPLIEEATEKLESSFKAFRARQFGAQRSLFEELSEAEQENLNGQLRLMEAVRDARPVLDYVLRAFGRDGRNPLTIPAWQLRALLECEDKPDGFRRVEGCLRALQELRFALHLRDGNGSARAFGTFLGEVQYVPRGPGRHTDGEFVLHLAPSAIGCLQVFAAGRAPAPLATRARRAAPCITTSETTLYNWHVAPPDAQRSELKSGYLRSQMALAPYYDQAHGFSTEQAALLRWIERELTLNRDTTRATGPELSGEDFEPRLYNRTFCPLLPPGRAYYGALGHFNHNPESGRKLATLMADIGYQVPPKRNPAQRLEITKRAMNDLRIVVEDALGGFVAVRSLPFKPKGGRRQSRGQAQSLTAAEERWLTREEAAHLSPEAMLHKTLWLIFVAPDFCDRLADDLENYHAQRYERGEAPFPIKVARDTPRELHKVSLAQRLRETRKGRKLSLRQVATLFNVSHITIDNWEKGGFCDADGNRRGKPIPDHVMLIMERWIENGTPPNVLLPAPD